MLQESDPVADASVRATDAHAVEVHASALGNSMAHQPMQARQSLLRLQRTHGNRHVQRVLALARKAEGEAEVAPEVESVIERAQGGGQSLESGVRRKMESAFGTDFSSVRVHTDAEANQLNQAVNALAFTTGQDIFFRDGLYQPSSSSGQELLAHELTHVVQQGGKKVQGKLVVGTPDDQYEQEADLVAKSVMNASEAPAAQESKPPRPGNRVQRQQATPAGGTGASQATAASPAPATQQPSATDVASNYEADALEFFETNMSTEMRTAAAVEGAALGRHASSTAGDQVRQICEPFERDQEIDTAVLNTVFALVGGGASIAEGGTSGTSDNAASRQANVGSRIVRAGLGVVQVWLPTLAGYRTVGSLKDAAIRELGEAAASGGETGSAQFQDYENVVMNVLRSDWQDEINRVKRNIQTDPNPQSIASIGRFYWPIQRGTYLDRLRRQYGSQSSYSGSMVNAILGMLHPRLEQLRHHLQEAKDHRERVQGWGAIGGGIAGGAAIGAGIGVWGFGVGAIPGAVVGGIVGGVLGLGAAIKIWSD
ncbi:MAG: DUF4157 domain-containing protein [Acidobacteriia bacterium]|nr:DUF4157 domain-containing protein [Terriglobia bacterium]